MAVPSPQASHIGVPGSIPGEFTRKLWWTKLHWERFSSEHVGFPLSVRAHWQAPQRLNEDTASVMYYYNRRAQQPDCRSADNRSAANRVSVTGGHPIIII